MRGVRNFSADGVSLAATVRVAADSEDEPRRANIGRIGDGAAIGRDGDAAAQRENTRGAGYVPLKDVYGQPAIALRADIPRAIYEEGADVGGYPRRGSGVPGAGGSRVFARASAARVFAGGDEVDFERACGRRPWCAGFERTGWIGDGAYAARWTQLRVLAMEDNSVNQALARRSLEQRGQIVVIAENGRAALDALERDAFDLILMDVQMPVLGGLEVTACIERAAGCGARIPTLTANALAGGSGAVH